MCEQVKETNEETIPYRMWGCRRLAAEEVDGLKFHVPVHLQMGDHLQGQPVPVLIEGTSIDHDLEGRDRVSATTTGKRLWGNGNGMDGLI